MTGDPWISGPCADGRCWECPGWSPIPEMGLCAHSCHDHDHDTAPARED